VLSFLPTWLFHANHQIGSVNNVQSAIFVASLISFSIVHVSVASLAPTAVAIRQAGASPDADAFGEKFYDLDGLVMFQAKAVEGL